MKNRLLQLKFGGWLIIPILLLYLPADFFDHGTSICLSVLLFHRTCIGCGMTRAVQHVMHGEISTAWNYNHFVVIVFPVLVYLWIRFGYKLYRELQLAER